MTDEPTERVEIRAMSETTGENLDTAEAEGKDSTSEAPKAEANEAESAAPPAEEPAEATESTPEEPAAPAEANDAETTSATSNEPAEPSEVAESPEEPAAPAATTESALDASTEPAAPERGPVLLFLRHADAGDPAAWPGDDADRPLSKKGRRQSERLAKHLDRLRLPIDAILTSPKKRAADTARIVGKAVGVRPSVDERLAAGFDGPALQALLEARDSKGTIVLVGHDPDFSDLVSWLTEAPIALRKGALARIDLEDGHVAAGEGALVWLLPPGAVAG